VGFTSLIGVIRAATTATQALTVAGNAMGGWVGLVLAGVTAIAAVVISLTGDVDKLNAANQQFAEESQKALGKNQTVYGLLDEYAKYEQAAKSAKEGSREHTRAVEDMKAAQDKLIAQFPGIDTSLIKQASGYKDLAKAVLLAAQAKLTEAQANEKARGSNLQEASNAALNTSVWQDIKASLAGPGAAALRMSYIAENASSEAYKTAQKAIEEHKVRLQTYADQMKDLQRKIEDLADPHKTPGGRAMDDTTRLGIAKLIADITGKANEIETMDSPGAKFFASWETWLEKLRTSKYWEMLKKDVQLGAETLPQKAADARNEKLINDQQRANDALTRSVRDNLQAENERNVAVQLSDEVKRKAIATKLTDLQIEGRNLAAVKSFKEALDEVGKSELELIAIRGKRQGLSDATTSGQQGLLLTQKMQEAKNAAEEYGKTEMELLKIQLSRILTSQNLTDEVKKQAQAYYDLAVQNKINSSRDVDPSLQMMENLRNKATADPTIVNTPKYKADLIEAQKAASKFKADQGDIWGEVKYAALSATDAISQGLMDTINSLNQAGSSWNKFRDMLKSILSDILKAIEKYIIQQMIVNQVVSAIFGSSSSGSAGIASYNTGTGNYGDAGYDANFASGGKVFAGMTAMVGERGPEVVTFPANGYVTPNNQLGGTQQVNNTSINVVVNSDGSSQTSTQSSKASAEKLTQMMQSTVEQWYRQEMRTNGIVFNSIRSAARA